MNMQKDLELLKTSIENNSSVSKEELFSAYDKEISEIREFPHFFGLSLNDEEIIKYYFQLRQIIDETRQCSIVGDKCSTSIGHHLDVCRLNDSNELYFFYTECPKMIKFKKDNAYKQNYLYNYYDNTFLTNVKFNKNWIGDDVHITKNNMFKSFIALIKKNSKHGLYVYGSFGLGKTYAFSMFANFYAEKENKTITFIFMPDLVDKIKSGFNNNLDREEANKILDNAKECDVLFIDDLGAEFASDWFYANSFLNILNYRYTNNKLTFFNSNSSVEDFEKKLLTKLKGEDKSNTAHRIIDRIRALVDNNFIKLEGNNLRFKEK